MAKYTIEIPDGDCFSCPLLHREGEGYGYCPLTDHKVDRTETPNGVHTYEWIPRTPCPAKTKQNKPGGENGGTLNP